MNMRKTNGTKTNANAQQQTTDNEAREAGTHELAGDEVKWLRREVRAAFLCFHTKST